MRVPAVCPVHGARPSNAISISGDASDITLADNTTQCDLCGRPMRLAEGTFSYRSGVVVAQDMPQWSLDAFESVGVIVKRLHEVITQPDLAPEQVLAEATAGLAQIAELSLPGAAHLASEARNVIRKPKTKKAKAVVAIGVIAAMYNGIAVYPDFSVGVSQLVRDVQAVGESVLPDGSLEGSESPRGDKGESGSDKTQQSPQDEAGSHGKSSSP